MILPVRKNLQTLFTCHTPTIALAMRMRRMTKGSTKAVIVPSPSSNQARVYETEDKTKRKVNVCVQCRSVLLKLISFVCISSRVKLIQTPSSSLLDYVNLSVYVFARVLCRQLCFLTKEMHAASSKIRTSRSSNCSRTSSHSDFPVWGNRGTQWAAAKRNTDRLWCKLVNVTMEKRKRKSNNKGDNKTDSSPSSAGNSVSTERVKGREKAERMEKKNKLHHHHWYFV